MATLTPGAAQADRSAARPAFLDAVAAELEAEGQPRGVGIVHQVGRVVNGKFWDPPSLPNASPVHRGSAA